MPTSQPQAAIRRKLRAAARLARPPEGLPPAWFLTDPDRTPNLAAILRRLPRGMGVIYRHFGAANRYQVGAVLARIARQRGLILLVSADPLLATRIRAHGVHWPEQRLKGVRSRNPRFIETISAHSRAAIARARRLGVDAVIVSTVFPSRSRSAGQAMGAHRFRLIAKDSALPLYALGGVHAGNASRAMTHAAGWAAIDAVIEGWGR